MSDSANPVPVEEFKAELTSLIPHLRAFARSLCNDATQADDLAQEAMLKAWNARSSFEAGTNMKAWAFTILRNLFYSEKRRSWRSQPLDPEVAEATIVSHDTTHDNLELLALRNALAKLPPDQREALILVGAGGLSYEEAAEIAGVAVGTVKSRVSRARKSLVELVEANAAGFNSDKNLRGEGAFNDIMAQVDALTGESRT